MFSSFRVPSELNYSPTVVLALLSDVPYFQKFDLLSVRRTDVVGAQSSINHSHLPFLILRRSTVFFGVVYGEFFVILRFAISLRTKARRVYRVCHRKRRTSLSVAVQLVRYSPVFKSNVRD
jgi:hypothetical protein